jgi:hypothetical protein
MQASKPLVRCELPGERLAPFEAEPVLWDEFGFKGNQDKWAE